MSLIHISVDCMSGDFGPQSNLQSVISALNEKPDAFFHLCGDEKTISNLLPSHQKERVQIYHTDHCIPSSLKPSAALRMREETSLHKALTLVSNHTASITVSSANTGAYMALSLKKIGLQPNVKRPAIGKMVPTLYEGAYCDESLMLDLGANINCTSETLVSFVDVARNYLQDVRNIQLPKVAILNIGSESGKGTEELQNTFVQLSDRTDIDFTGFIEGNEVLAGIVDIIVCDGFHGNIALKSMEGTIKGIYGVIKRILKKPSIKSKTAGLLLRNDLKKAFEDRYNPKKYNGALLMGLKAPVVKSHGGADADSFYHALITAYNIVKTTKVPEAALKAL